MKNILSSLKICTALLAVLIFSACSKTETVDDQQFKGWIVGQAAGGYGTILSTSNDGLTWSRQGSQSLAAGVDLYDVQGFDQYNAWVAGGIFKGFGLILHTTDGGVTWVRQGDATQVPAGKIFAVRALSKLQVWVAGENSMLLHSTDGGSTWTTVTIQNLPLTTFNAITSFGNSIWAAGATTDTLTGETKGVLVYSPDGGSSWIRKESGIPVPSEFLDVSAASDSILYVAGASMVLKSGNGGNSWLKVLSFTNRNVNGICAVDVQNIWAVGDGDGIFHSVSGGTKWDTIRPSLKGFKIMGVTVADVNRIWIVGTPASGYGTGNIIYSRNAGSTWFIEDSPVQAGFRRVSFASAVR